MNSFVNTHLHKVEVDKMRDHGARVLPNRARRRTRTMLVAPSAHLVHRNRDAGVGEALVERGERKVRGERYGCLR